MKTIFVRFRKGGIHCYPDAPEGVEFLKHPHRHEFHFEVEMEVFHNDREVEFILLKRELDALYGNKILNLDFKSCEMLADELYQYLRQKYPNRYLMIEVSEDGENGARGYYEKESA